MTNIFRITTYLSIAHGHIVTVLTLLYKYSAPTTTMVSTHCRYHSIYHRYHYRMPNVMNTN